MQDQWRPQVTTDRKEPSTSWPPQRNLAQPDTMSLSRQADTAPWAAGLQPAMRMQPPNAAAVSAGQFMMGNPSLLQPSPQNQAFLATATNLMMGMGLAAPSAPASRTQDARFDAYKGVPGAQLPRY